jgi:acyl carrier protein
MRAGTWEEDMDTQIRAELTEFIVTNYLFGDVSRAPRDEDSLVDEGIIDSTGVLELIEFLESHFGIEVSEAEALPQNLGSISSLTKFVMSKGRQPGADGPGRREGSPEMTVELSPITDADIAEVADFLRVNYKDRIPWVIMAGPWKVDAPNHGFMLHDGQRIVGAHTAFYSERQVAGRVERFCDLGTWYVLPEFRSHSIRLIKALLAQDGYHFTALTPGRKVVSIHTQLGFHPLDTSAALIPNLPWPTPPGRTTISTDPDVIESALAGEELELYRDHAQALAARHLVLLRGPDSCYVMYRPVTIKSVPAAVILHVSNPQLFHRAILPLTRHLLVRHRLLATLGELRIIGHRPPLSFKVTSWPKMYRSASLEPDQIDDLYSELVCVPW